MQPIPNNTMKAFQYIENNSTGFWRKDIEGIQAVAIIPVIINHFGSKFLPGGFLGVDIFFILSGYLITQQITRKNYLQNTKSVKEFLLRRFFRIFPSLLVCVVIFSIVFSFFLIPDLHTSLF